MSNNSLLIDDAASKIFEAISNMPIHEYHGHYKWKQPIARDVLDLLLYHYATEEAHANGMPADVIKDIPVTQENQVKRLGQAFTIAKSVPTNSMFNTWFTYAANHLFNAKVDLRDEQSIADLDIVIRSTQSADRLKRISHQYKIKTIGLTNPIGDDLEGVTDQLNYQDQPLFRTAARVDDIFYLRTKGVMDILERVYGKEIKDLADYVTAADKAIKNILFQDGKKIGHSIVMSNQPLPSVPLEEIPQTIEIPHDEIKVENAEKSFENLMKFPGWYEKLNEDIATVQGYLMETLMSLCESYDVTFQYMPGVGRNKYPRGTPSGRDVADSSIGFAPFLNLMERHPEVRVSGSVLHTAGEEELTSAAKHNPNLWVSGFW